VQPEIFDEVLKSLREGGFLIKAGEIMKMKQSKKRKDPSKMLSK
jgi:hypothetical protein